MERFYPTNGALFQLLDIRYYWLGFLDGRGALLAAVVCCVLAAWELRLGLASATMLLFLCGYPSLQFNSRHYFMLELGALWAFAVSLCLAWNGLKRLRNGFLFHKPWQAALRGAAFGGVIAAGLFLLYACALAVQYVQVGKFFEAYAAAKRAPLDLQPVQEKPGEFTVSGLFPAQEQAGKFRVREAIIALNYTSGPGAFALEPLYARENKPEKPTQSISVTAGEAPGDAWVYFPVEEKDDSYFGRGPLAFRGLNIPKYPERLKGVYKLDINDKFPLALVLSEGSDYRQLPRRLRWNGENVPSEICGERAARQNLLTNGSFEAWDATTTTPVGAMLPQAGSSIARESKAVASGKFALRQTWSANPRDTEGDTGFMLPGKIPSGVSRVSLFVRCWNQSDKEIELRLKALVSAPGTATSYTYLPGASMKIGPSKDYVEQRLEFSLPQNAPPTLVVQTLGNSAFLGGEIALWDDIRLAPGASPRNPSPLLFE